MSFQMILVISSPSSSTTGFLTLILRMADMFRCGRAKVGRTARCRRWGDRKAVGLEGEFRAQDRMWEATGRQFMVEEEGEKVQQSTEAPQPDRSRE
jgi:hypothetical protein